MSTTRRARPSPAIVVAVLALVAAVAGTAVAANPSATSSAINKKKVKKIAKKQVNKLAPSLAVAEADEAEEARNLRGLAYAKINADGTVGEELKGISQANVTTDGPGDYCIDGLDPAPRGISATLDRSAAFNAQIYGKLSPNNAGHCAGSQAAVETYNPTNASSNQPIYIVLF
jgi:hypothetical protein